MSKLIKKYDKDFTICSNSIFKDKNLSYKELGLLVQLLSLPDNWEFNVKGLAKIHKDGEDSVKTGLNQLEKYGYLTREQKRDDKGKMSSSDYFIYQNPNDNIEYLNKKALPQEDDPFMSGDSPVGENPTADKPLADNPTVVKPHNKESMYKEKINKSTSTTRPDLDKSLKEKTNVDGMMVNDRQYRDINDMIQMIATREIRNTTKTDLLRFLHKLYDEEKQDFLVNGVAPIYSLKNFIKGYFNDKTRNDEEEIDFIKEQAEKGNEFAINFMEENPSLFKKH